MELSCLQHLGSPLCSALWEGFQVLYLCLPEAVPPTFRFPAKPSRRDALANTTGHSPTARVSYSLASSSDSPAALMSFLTLARVFRSLLAPKAARVQPLVFWGAGMGKCCLIHNLLNRQRQHSLLKGMRKQEMAESAT